MTLASTVEGSGPDAGSPMAEQSHLREGESETCLSRRIGELRTARHWTQADLARAAGLSPPYVKALEDGTAREPSARTLGKLCQALDVDVVDMMQAAGALPDDYHECAIRSELEMTMYLRRHRRLSERFVNTLVRLIRLAEIDERSECKES